MILANKQGWWARVLDAYVARKVRGAFRGVWVRGALPPGGNLLVYCNHLNFWDGFIAHQLSAIAGWEGYCMMEERTLSQYRFLSRLGAFSVRRGDPRSAISTLRHARTLLARERAAVFLFPEGVLRPLANDVAAFERGAEVLARVTQARCLPVAVRYVFAEHERPDVLIDVGSPHAPEPAESMHQRLATHVERLNAVRSLEGFEPRLRGARGVAERWDSVRALPAPSSDDSRSTKLA